MTNSKLSAVFWLNKAIYNDKETDCKSATPRSESGWRLQKPVV